MRPARSDHRAALSRRLVRLREEAGLTQTALADRLGLTQSEVSKLERGERAMEFVRLRAWLRVLGTSLAAFAEAVDRDLERLDTQVDGCGAAPADTAELLSTGGPT